VYWWRREEDKELVLESLKADCKVRRGRPLGL
jgi:hypothetical protein